MDLALRPMSTSQVLDRTFYLYRNNFVLFAGIAIITPTLKLIALLVQLKVFGPLTVPQQPDQFTPQFIQAFLVRIVVAFIVGSIVYLVGTALASSATAYAVSMVHLGKTTTIAESYSKVNQIFGRILGLFVTISAFTFGPLILSYVVLFGGLFVMLGFAKSGGGQGAILAVAGIGIIVASLLLIGSAIWVFFALCRFALAVPACTLENQGVMPSIRRSNFLTFRARGGIFGIIFLTGLMTVILTWVLQMPALLASNAMVMTAKTHLNTLATVWMYIADFLGYALAGPIATIALVLVYYDQRVRKEAFDLQLMMEAVGQQSPQQMAATVPPSIG